MLQAVANGSQRVPTGVKQHYLSNNHPPNKTVIELNIVTKLYFRDLIQVAKIVYICSRDEKETPCCQKNMALLSQRLTPDNIKPKQAQIIINKGIFIGIINPSDVLPIKNNSVCMGYMFGDQDDWWQPNATVPDGTYALFRGDEHTIELVTDTVASRTIWYVQTNNYLMASTSQRAIVMLLKSFEPNKNVFPWMISSGTLGPELSWDRRINMLPGSSRLVLERRSWKLNVIREPLGYSTNNVDTARHENNLKNSIEHTFDTLDLNLEKWVLPLSGGVDSRAILMMLKNRPGLKSITWGLRSSLCDKNNDAYIAKHLAANFHVEHSYFQTDVSQSSIDKIFTRFLIAGEGRVDNISGYMDGFNIWKTLYEKGVQGIIRGDEAFGCYPVKSAAEVFRNMNFQVLDDFSNTDTIRECIATSPQERPTALLKMKSESLDEWRDRLNREYEFPTVFAALNDLKLAYVEIINPLISRHILSQVVKLPDSLRADKALFRKIVNSLCPDIKFAKKAAIEQKGNLLRREDVVNVVKEELKSDHARTLFGGEFLDDILFHVISVDNNRANNPNPILPRLARKIKTKLRLQTKNNIDINNVAFRLYLISKMNKLLSEDAQAFKEPPINS